MNICASCDMIFWSWRSRVAHVGNIFSRGKEKVPRKGRIFCVIRVSFTSIRGAARRGVRTACLRLYLLYSVACQPIYIGLDSAFTSRATGTRPEDHRRVAPRDSLTISARLIFAKLHPRPGEWFLRVHAHVSPLPLLPEKLRELRLLSTSLRSVRETTCTPLVFARLRFHTYPRIHISGGTWRHDR